MKRESHAAPQLPHLVMRRALGVDVVAWLIVLVLGLMRAGQDIDREVAAALHLSALGANLSRVVTLDDRVAIEELRRLQRVGPLRHLSLMVRDDRGRTLLAPDPSPGRLPNPARRSPPDAMAAMLRVMLVDDRAIARQGYRRLIEFEGDMQVVAEHADADAVSLSPREFEVVQLLLEGCTTEQVGVRLGLSTKTVANYQTIIRQKHGVQTTMELLRIARERGWTMA